MSMDNQYSTKTVDGGNSSSTAVDLNALLAQLESGAIVLFAQGFFKLTANLELPAGVTLIIEGDTALDGAGFTLNAQEGSISVSEAVSEFTLDNITIEGGLTGSALLTVLPDTAPLTFNATDTVLKPASGGAALSFERAVVGSRDIAVTPAGDGEAVDTTFGIDLGSGSETTVLPKVYQQEQGKMALSTGLLSVNSPESFKSATVTIEDTRSGDTLSLNDDANTLAQLLRVSMDFDAQTGVLSITPAEGRLLNAGLVELLLDSVKFENNTTQPGLSREFTYTLTDASGNIITASAILLINDLNAAPELQLNAIDESGWAPGDATATFAQGDGPVDITTDAEIVLTDDEDDVIAFVELRIVNPFDTAQEALLLRATPKSGDLFGLSPAELAQIAGITVTYDEATSTLRLEASAGALDDLVATTDLLQFLVNEVKYNSDLPNPTLGGTTRTIEVVAKDALTSKPASSDVLSFIIALEGDDLQAINAASDAAAMRTAIDETDEVKDLLIDARFTDLSTARQDALLLDLVNNRPSEEEGLYITFDQFENDFFNPLADAYDAIRIAVADPSVASIQAALDALPEALTLSGEPGLDKTTLQSLLDTFDTLTVLKQPILDAVAGASGVDSLVDVFATAAELAPGVAFAEIDQASTAAEVKAILDDVFIFVTGATVDAYEALSADGQTVLAVALLQSDATDFEGLQTDFEATLERLNALSENRLQAVKEDVAADLAALESADSTLETVIAAREAVQAAVTAGIDAANSSAKGALTVAVFEAIRDAMDGIVAAGLREVLDDNTPVEDISAADLTAAVTLFESLSVETQIGTLAAVQSGDSYTTLGSVLDAFEPAIKGILLTALNAAGSVADVNAVLADAGKLYPEVAEPNLDDSASFVAVAEFLLLGAEGAGFPDFDTAAAFYFNAVEFAQAGEALVDAVNAKDASGVETQLGIGRDKLAAMDIVLGDVTVAVLDGVLTAIDGLVDGRFQAAVNDLADNAPSDGWAASNLYDGSLTSLAEGLILFRVAVEDAVDAAGDATVGSFGEGALDGVVAALEVVQGKKSDATINGQGVGDVIAAVSAVATALNALVPGRVEALNADLAANANTGDGFSSFTAMFQVLEPLVAFRTDVQAAVEAGVAGTLGVAELDAVRDSLAALDGKSVNGETVDGDAVNAQFNALTGRITDLVPGRFVAVQNDLAANSGNFGSFTGMITLFDGLLTFREEVQDAVIAGSNGTLALADIEAITTALEALPTGTLINNTDVALVIEGQEGLEALLGDDQLIEGRFSALAADLGDNANGGFASYTNMVTLLQPLAEFRIELGEAIDTAAAGDFARGDEGTLEGVLAKLEAIAAVKSDATINGQAIDGIISGKEELIARVTALGNDPEPRFDAFVEDLKGGSYTSFTGLILELDKVLLPREAVESAVNAVIAAADGSDLGALTVGLFEEVQVALAAIEDAELTTVVNSTPVEDISAAALAAELTTFAELRESTQEAVLAEVQTGSFATLAGVLDAFPAALDTVGLALVNDATTATELLDALADVAVYVTDNTALNSVLALRDTDAARAEALANDFLLNSDGTFASLADAGALLTVLEDVYSGLDINFDADLFTLGTKGDASFTLTVGDASVELANIGSIEFADKTAHVAGSGALQTVTAAIGAAGTDGDVVLLAAGDYSETVNINKAGLTILGPNAGISGHADNSVNDARGDEAKFIASGSNATFRVTADNVTIDGVQLALVPTGTTPQIDVSGDGASFLNNIINAALYQKASGLLFEGNFVGDFGDALGKGYSGNAIVQDSNNVTRSDWVIKGNVFDGTDRGIVLASSGSVGSTYENLLVEGNVFQGINGRGVQFGDNASIDGVIITGNTFKDGSAGIGVFNPVSPIEGLSISGNEFDTLDFGVIINAPAAAGLFVDQDSNTFTDVIQAVSFLAPIPELDVAGVLGGGVVNFADVGISFDDSRYEITQGEAVVTVSGIGKLAFSDQNVLVVGNGGFATIQEAVDAALAGDTVLIADGTYDEVVSIPSGKAGLTILGSENTVVNAVDVKADGVTVENLKVQGGATISGSNAGIYVAADNVTLTGLILTGPGEGEPGAFRGIITEGGKGVGLAVTDVTAAGWATGIYLNPGATDAVVTESDFSGNTVGMSIDGVDNVTLTGNTFGGTLEDLGLGAAGIAEATGNTFVSGQFGNFTGQIVSLGANTVAGFEKEGVILGTLGDDVFAATDADEAFFGQDGNDLVTFEGNLSDYSVSITDGVITVSRDGEINTLTGVEALKFADGFAVLEGLSIQTAIDLASADDTINVLAGVYEEAINLNKAVSLVGPNAEITAHDTDRESEAVIGGKVTISADGASLTGVTLTKPSTSTSTNDINFSGWGGNNLLVLADDVTVQNNVIEVFGAAGGFSDGSGFVRLGGASTFEGNVVKAGDGYDAANDARGASAVWINADTDDAVTVSNNHLLVSTNVTATPNDADAIFLNNAGAVVIDGNLMKGTDGGFVAFGDYGTLTITNNTIEDYAKTGLRIFESTNDTKPDVVLSGNKIDDSGDRLVFVDGAVKLGSDGSGFDAVVDNFTGIPAIYRVNDLDGKFGVFADGNLSLFADVEDAQAAAGASGVIWDFDAAQFLVFDGMSIQAAVGAAEAGDTITVADGNYGPVTLDKGLSLIAAGTDVEITGAGVNQGAAIRVNDGVDGVSVTGFSLSAEASDLAAVYLVGNNELVSFVGNTISGGSGHAVLTGGGMENVALLGNTITGDGPASVVYVNGETSLGNASSIVSLIGNTITGNPGAGLLVGLESTGGVVQGNTFQGSASYAVLELWGTGVTVGGSEDGEPNTFGAFPRVVVDQTGSYALTGLLADNDFAEPEILLIRNADTGNIYNSLADAFADAQSGETVKIAAGELDLSSVDRLTVPEGVTLTGAGLDIDGTPLTTLKGGLLELADGAKVEGLAFTEYDARLGGGQPVVLVSGADATVTESTFTVDGASSAYASEIRVTGENATITDNTISRDVAGDVSGSSIGNSAISAGGVGKITITGNTLERAIIGVVTAADGVDLTITGNTVTPTVVSNDGIFVTGPGFGNIPDGSTVNIGTNTYIANGNGDLLGLQLRGTVTEGFDFTGFATPGQDFFQGGGGDDTFALSGAGTVLDGGIGGIDTVKLDDLYSPSDFSKGQDGDVLLAGNTLRNIERVELEDIGVVSLVPADGFSILLVGDDDRPDLRVDDGNLLLASLLVQFDGDVPNALTLLGGDYRGSEAVALLEAFALTIEGDSQLPLTISADLLTVEGSGNISFDLFAGFLDASELTGALSADVLLAGSVVAGGDNVDVLTLVEQVGEDDDGLPVTAPVAFDRSLLVEDPVIGDQTVEGALAYALDPENDDSGVILGAVETLVFDNVTLHVAGVGTGRSVQEAVDAAGPDDIVFIGNGTYDEVVTIPSDKTGLTIIGSDNATVTAFDVKADGVTIDNVTVDGGGNTSGSFAGVYVAASNVSLIDLTLTGPEQGETGGQARGILTESGKGAGLSVTNVTATDWATGIYLNPGATGAVVTGSTLTGNYVGMSIDGEDGVTLTGNTFDGTVEDLGLGAAGIATATGNTFVSGQFGNFTGQVVTLGGNTVAGTGFDSIKLGSTGNDTITLVSETGITLVVGGSGTDTVAAPDEAAFGLRLNSITAEAGEITLAFSNNDEQPTVTAVLQDVERFQATIDTLLDQFGSVAEDGVLTASFFSDSGFPVKLGGAGDRPDIFFDARDLPGVMALAAQQLAEEEVVITLMDDAATYPGIIDLTELADGFNATSITVNREGSESVFIGPVFAAGDTVVLGDGVDFANVAPQLVDVDVFEGPQVNESLTGDPFASFTVSQLNTLFRDDDFGSDLAGIALVGIEAPGEGIVTGRWEFKTTGDSAFRDVLTVLNSENLVLSEATAMLLADTTQLRFVPDAATDEDRNFGRVPELSFVAVDSTQELIGGGQFTTSGRLRTDDVSVRGDATAYSAEMATFTKQVAQVSTPGDFNTTENALGPVTEDLFTTADGSFVNGDGDTVADIFGTSFGDPLTASDLKGVVVVANAAVASQGAWQYKASGGWVDIGAVTAADALFLAPDAELRFVPNWNFNGQAPELSVRAVDEAGTLATGDAVDVSGGGGIGTNFSASIASLGVEIAPEADIYTFGQDGLTATLNFEGNPGSVFEYNGLPVISLLNFDRESDAGARDLIEFGFVGLEGAPVFVNALNNQQNSAANVILFNANTIVTESNVGDTFVNAAFATGKGFSQFFPNGFSGAPGEVGEAIGIFQQSDGSVSVWFTSEVNAANAGIDYVKLGYFGGSEWSANFQDDHDANAVPTATVAELQQLIQSDFAFV
ncbi:beta strand repeat-containing protein [Roseinatronobacter sp. NSM]|uniref:beta strand repeat-containing protein n=1 Tax=Roseinatronobacter sp. NSM TaxID=3457785 RepID=UPI004036E645